MNYFVIILVPQITSAKLKIVKLLLAVLVNLSKKMGLPARNTSTQEARERCTSRRKITSRRRSVL